VRYTEPKEFYIKLGERIRNLRKEQKLSQSDLGYKSDLDKSVIQRLEMARTNPTVKTLLKIADGLDITLSILCDIDKRE